MSTSPPAIARAYQGFTQRILSGGKRSGQYPLPSVRAAKFYEVTKQIGCSCLS